MTFDMLENGEGFLKKAFKIIVVLAVAAAVMAGFGLYIEYLKVREVGAEYVSVYIIRIATALIAGVVIFALTMLLTAVNGAVLRRAAIRRGELVWIMKRKYVFGLGALLGLIVALFNARNIGGKFLMFKNAVNYGESDPVFGKDISYFLFKREFWIDAAGVLDFVIFALLIYTVGAYFVMYISDGRDGGALEFLKDKAVFSHCAALVFLMGLVKALTYRFTAEGLVYSKTADVTGAGYADVKIRLPFYTAAPYIIGVLIILAAVFLFKRKYKAVGICVLTFPALLVIMWAVVALTNSFVVAPQEVALEQPYIESNIKYTKLGFGLDNIETSTFDIKNDLTAQDIEDNAETVDNIRITDMPATLSVSNSTKSVRNYYTFTDSDIVPYTVNGKKTALNIAPRELDADKLPENAKNYINLHLRYTHGYGIVANTINDVNADGQPVYRIDSMPIVSQEGFPVVTQPRIYYGEKTDNYVVVNTDYDELDYVTDDEQTGEGYSGSGGIEMKGLNRLLFAIDNMDYKLLISGYIHSDSKLLINRNIFDRVKTAVPFMEQDDDPYIVIDDNGNLKWVLDLYTTSDKMPYSQTYSGVNYIRNSAKAVIDAYSGEVKIYITDTSDPIIRTYAKIYPDAFAGEGLPEDIAAHIRCPELLFKIQYEVYLRYHMTDTTNFYGNSDLWTTPKEKYMNNETVDIQPYYNLMQLQNFGDESAELVLMKPFAPINKENLMGWLASTSTGELMLYRFPTDKTVYGTLHIENRIDSDDSISKEISLWDQGGSNVIKGNLLVIPVKNSLLYVEPIYLTTSNNAALPEVKRVIVAYDEEVVMERTLRDALDKLFGTETAPTETDTGDAALTNTNVTSIVQAYEAVEEAQRSGDWEKFGQAMEALKNAIYSEYPKDGDSVDQEF